MFGNKSLGAPTALLVVGRPARLPCDGAPTGGNRAGRPTILGVVRQMIYYGDHPPPHFQALYAGAMAKIAIENLQLIDGSSPKRALGLVLEWATAQQEELTAAFDRAASLQAPGEIAP